ncbi:sugar transferase [Ureibacillus massiliensis]|uniref:sugar transferase n=1 Tax=Ureibacillus massiliensis TaxID=292806 RepID=UPI000689279F|nr:sugar transferase [Ureibacillus massiliensis]
MNKFNAWIYRDYFKRPMDIILSIIALIILSPLLIIIALLVKIKLGSPVIYKQKRPGLNEKVFTIYKFRTMSDERDEYGLLLPDSVRLTKFGRFLRSTSLDELPELINILKGDMSIVGPRPLSVSYLPYYTEQEKIRHSVRPGLSGLAQINGRNIVKWEQRFYYDQIYVKNITLIGDIKIILKTILIVIKRSDIGESGVNSQIDLDKCRADIFKRSDN